MADGKVNLTFSTIAQLQGLNQLSDGLKRSGREIKDFGDAGAKIVGQLSAQLKGPLVEAVGTTFDAIKGLAQGGIWGTAAALATKAIDLLSAKLSEARERARELGKVLRAEAAEGVAALDKNVKGLAASMAKLTGGIESSLRAQDRETDAQTRYAVARIGTRAAKGEMSRAEAAYEAEMARLSAEMQKSWRERKAWDERMQSIHKEVAEAERNVAAANANQAKFAEDNARVLAVHARLQADANADYSESILDPNQRRRVVAGYKLLLKQFEETYKDVLDNQKKVEGHLADATDALAKAREAEADVRLKWEIAGERNLLAEEQKRAVVAAEEARKRQEAAAEEARRRQEAVNAEIKAGEDLQRQEDEWRKQLRQEAKDAEKKRVKALQDSADKLKDEVGALDKAIAAQKKLADEWEANAQKARGKDFAAWQSEQRAADAAQTAEEKRFGRANASAARRANSIRRDARHGWASARDRAWLAQYDEWSAAQSAANNPHLSEAEKLEAERAAKVGEIANILSRVEGKLDKAITME